MLIAGFVLLVGGGESLVRGASSLARTIGMSSLVVGLTVVSFATSAPELAVSTGAALGGHPGLAVGNVVGSNIANILLVLGLSAVFVPLIVKSQIVRADIPVMVALSIGLLLLALDGHITRLDGTLLLAVVVIYVTITIVISRRRKLPIPMRHGPHTGGSTQDAQAPTPQRRSVPRDLLLVLVGVGLLVAGAQLLVRGASEVAAALGVSDLIIGLTVVAIGTSLPELATSVIAVIRGERDLAVGNIVGSNVFNIGAVLGITAIVAPDGIEVASAAIRFDLPIMIAVALALLPVAFTGQAVARWEGVLFFILYAAYIAFLLLQATDHAALEPFSAVMLWFVVPITASWLLLLAAYEIGLRRGRRSQRD
ncbi:calcium/sodium antiporter [Phytoactinopolyspora sp. XMNu-373]|uniref:Calcium/sodium antiporter n=2 Tax=Phytoactinopolyspora mesophila TaxID=2650750 RepID=A0A7K3LZ65_9ACTN|nr:calcium/sodium antiporter [Phytoactinopolyspora mesophila]NDL56321.1 calcium/sodium antiporter [Phytoactinopolyspora mesophila]